MRLFLVRHGRTFRPDEEPFFVGRGEDLPLTEEGLAQALPVAQALTRAHVDKPFYFTSRLRRTRDFAAAVMNHREESRPLSEDPLLDEIDYGDWSQKTHRAIHAQGQGTQLAAWSQHSRWPDVANFRETADEVRARAVRFASQAFEKNAQRDVVVVGHNGQLRYFLALIENAEAVHFARGTFKLGCGHMGLVARAEHDALYRLRFWNYAPGTTTFGP